MEYILSPKDHKTCIFCGVSQASPEERKARFVIFSGERVFVMLNRYPFASGHLLVLPHAHQSSLEGLSDADYDALFRLVRASAERLKKAVNADGLNIGINLGATAGAGIAEHLHVHIVPRWPGDTNFMPVVADVRVMPQALEKTRDYLEPLFSDLSQDKTL